MVNPPQKPVVKSRKNELSTEFHRLKRAKMTPKTKHPNKFTIRVPHGNPLIYATFIKVER